MDNNDVTWKWRENGAGGFTGERSDFKYSVEIYLSGVDLWIADIYEEIKGYLTFVTSKHSETINGAKLESERYCGEKV